MPLSILCRLGTPVGAGLLIRVTTLGPPSGDAVPAPDRLILVEIVVMPDIVLTGFTGLVFAVGHFLTSKNVLTRFVSKVNCGV